MRVQFPARLSPLPTGGSGVPVPGSPGTAGGSPMTHARRARNTAIVAAVGVSLATAPQARSDHPLAILVGSSVVAAGVIFGASVVASAILLDDVLTTDSDDDCD